MTDDKQLIQSNVDVSELKEGMIILAYTGFNEKYKILDENTCKWVQHNFKGSSTVVVRADKEASIPVSEMSVGDHLNTIENLPTSLGHITRVNKKLVEELRKRGFVKFTVKLPSKVPSAKNENQKAAIEEANLFVHKVKENIKVCESATHAVENLIDNARQGKTNIKDVESCVDNITGGESADAIGAIISLKTNDQVYAHCVDVAVVFSTTYFEIVQLRGFKSAFKDEKEAMLAAFLHDIGKAKVPKEILDSTAPFKRNSKEMQLIRSHPETGAKLLSEMGMSETFSNMAHYHHVKLDATMASSYPKDVNGEDILFETRLLALIDAYQALTAGRSYKKSWTPPAVMRYLDATAAVEFDLDLWQNFQSVMGHYPRGSFVKLSDGTFGFVVTVPKTDALRPQVAIIRNAEGEDLQNHYLIDLHLERDISITQDIDVKGIYKDKSLEVFASINIR
jgi:putative nucleotidyltransferase with HDIG domain